MKVRKWPALLAMVSALMLVAAACGGGGDGDTTADPGAGGDEQQDCTWTIGTIGALSGDLATIGQPILRGIQFGVEDVNAKGELPCTLELSEQDSQGNPDLAPPLVQTLVQTENLVAVVGSYFSGETDATGSIYEEAGVPLLSPSATNPDLSKNGWTVFFRLVGTDAQQGSEAATYLTDVAGASKVVVMHDNSEYGKGLADITAQTLGDTAVANIAINPEETDHSAEIAQAKTAGADAIFFGGYQPEFSEILKQAKDAGLTGTFVSGDGSKAPELAQDPTAEGAVVLCPCDDPTTSEDPEAQQFVEDMRASTGNEEDPGTYAVEGYDGVHIVAEALKGIGATADTPVEEIRTQLTQYIHENTFQGLSKEFAFEENGEIGTIAIIAYEVTGGEIKKLGLVSELAA